MRVFVQLGIQESPKFPFLFGGTFIEGTAEQCSDFLGVRFPFLFGGTFIEGRRVEGVYHALFKFPFLFGGTFIEGKLQCVPCVSGDDFPSFSEGLSLRDGSTVVPCTNPDMHFPSFSEGLSLRAIVPT